MAPSHGVLKITGCPISDAKTAACSASAGITAGVCSSGIIVICRITQQKQQRRRTCGTHIFSGFQIGNGEFSGGCPVCKRDGLIIYFAVSANISNTGGARCCPVQEAAAPVHISVPVDHTYAIGFVAVTTLIDIAIGVDAADYLIPGSLPVEKDTAVVNVAILVVHADAIVMSPIRINIITCVCHNDLPFCICCDFIIAGPYRVLYGGNFRF